MARNVRATVAAAIKKCTRAARKSSFWKRVLSKMSICRVFFSLENLEILELQESLQGVGDKEEPYHFLDSTDSRNERLYPKNLFGLILVFFFLRFRVI